MKAALPLALIITAVLLAVACDDDATSSAAPATATATGSGGAGSQGGAEVGGDPSVGGSGGTGGTIDPGPTKSPGCVDGAGLAEGEHQLTVEGLSRRFMVRLPLGYTRDRAWPLVLALHGNGGSISSWDGTSGPSNIRSELENDAVLIIAEAIDGQWRDYNMPADTWPARLETELVYFEDVITRAKTQLCLNEDAIFSMGFSGGGSFSGVLGCRRSDIRAIAVGGSVIYFDEQNCINTPAAWITVGQLELNSGREAFRDFFRDRASCAATSVATPPDPCVAYDGCDSNTPVHYCEHPGDHIWPDFGSAAMWDFFATFVDE